MDKRDGISEGREEGPTRIESVSTHQRFPASSDFSSPARVEIMGASLVGSEAALACKRPGPNLSDLWVVDTGITSPGRTTTEVDADI